MGLCMHGYTAFYDCPFCDPVPLEAEVDGVPATGTAKRGGDSIGGIDPLERGTGQSPDSPKEKV